MASFYVSHHKFPRNPQLFTVSLHKVASLGGEDNPNFSPTFPSAEEYWKVFIYTSGKNTLGQSVGPVVGDLRGTSVDVNTFIESKLALLCGQIDWSQQGIHSPENDVSAPVVVDQFPRSGQTDVPISSPIILRVQDFLPGNGINPASVIMKIDGYQVTPEVTGNKYDYTFTFLPLAIYD